MGVNLKCASCHDSFIDDWQLSDSYGLAGIYAEEKLEMVLCDKPTGNLPRSNSLFPELGANGRLGGAPKSPRATGQDHHGPVQRTPSRTVVNRLWARLSDADSSSRPTSCRTKPGIPAFSSWLAEDLVSHGWDLKRTIGLIMTSRAYQLPSCASLPEARSSFVFPRSRDPAPGLRSNSATHSVHQPGVAG